MQSRKGILIDRDGVLIEDCPDYIRNIEQIRFIPDVTTAVQRLWQAGYILCVVTNQAGISKGLYSLDTVQTIHHYIEYYLKQYGQGEINWYVCPHTNQDLCNCRKPKPGLLQQAMLDHNLSNYHIWMVGDHQRDIAAGHAVNCRTALVQTGLGKNQVFQQGGEPTWIVADFPTFVERLLMAENQRPIYT